MYHITNIFTYLFETEEINASTYSHSVSESTAYAITKMHKLFVRSSFTYNTPSLVSAKSYDVLMRWQHA